MTRALLLFSAIAAAAILSFRPIYEPDLWWHLAHGRENSMPRSATTSGQNRSGSSIEQRWSSW